MDAEIPPSVGVLWLKGQLGWVNNLYPSLLKSDLNSLKADILSLQHLRIDSSVGFRSEDLIKMTRAREAASKEGGEIKPIE